MSGRPTRARLATLRVLARAFAWLERVAAEGHRRTHVCPACGRSYYYGEPCIGK